MRKVIAAAVVAAGLGAALGSQLPSLSASDAVCRCWRRDMPQWAAWKDTHDAYDCKVIVPKDQGVSAQPCSLWNTAPPIPTGFDVRLTP